MNADAKANPAELTAGEAAARLAEGSLQAEALARACLDRIAEREEAVQAWTFLDPDLALQQAKRCDEAARAGLRLGPLHGLPVGVKDIFDTRDMPTENGTPLQAGRRPSEDSTVVALLRAAGAVILGKTVTTEMAYFAPGKTRNPHDPERTPGGSSSGSAAAVACGMAPLAIGSQTNGSVIRPAAFCGVYGFKPSHGLISRHGALPLSRSLDHVGVFARSLEDLALIAEPLARFDPADADTAPRGRLDLLATALQEAPVEPSFAFVKSPVWDQAEPDTRAAFAELAEFLGGACEEVELPDPYQQAHDHLRKVMHAEMATNLRAFYERGRERLSPQMVALQEDGRSLPALEYLDAVRWQEPLRRGLDKIFDRFDVILTPAAPGEAPRGLDGTGSPAFCSLWSFCGTPAVTLPLLQGSNGLPMGVQLVGRYGDDARLLRTARWLVRKVEEAEAAEAEA